MIQDGIAINGRFLTQRTSGVQRYARELLAAFSGEGGRSAARPDGLPSMLVPCKAVTRSAETAAPGSFRLKPVGRLSGHAWEQLELPLGRQKQFLVNLCNTAPLNRSNQLVVIHDTAVWRYPDAFSAAFRALYRVLQPSIARKSRMVATVSSFSAGELIHCFGLSPRTIEVIPNSGDHILRIRPEPSILAAHGLEAGRYLLAVGSANPTKNHAFLRHLEPLLAENHLPLVIAGARIPEVFAQSEAAASPWLRHVGYVSDGALRALYESAMGFIFPSLYEGFGVPPLEAMHCGCPVLAAKAAALPDTCADAALYFDPWDPGSLIKACRRFIGSAQLRGELQLRGRFRARQFDWTDSSMRLAALLKRI